MKNELNNEILRRNQLRLKRETSVQTNDKIECWSRSPLESDYIFAPAPTPKQESRKNIYLPQTTTTFKVQVKQKPSPEKRLLDTIDHSQREQSTSFQNQYLQVLENYEAQSPHNEPRQAKKYTIKRRYIGESLELKKKIKLQTLNRSIDAGRKIGRLLGGLEQNKTQAGMTLGIQDSIQNEDPYRVKLQLLPSDIYKAKLSLQSFRTALITPRIAKVKLDIEKDAFNSSLMTSSRWRESQYNPNDSFRQQQVSRNDGHQGLVENPNQHSIQNRSIGRRKLNDLTLIPKHNHQSKQFELPLEGVWKVNNKAWEQLDPLMPAKPRVSRRILVKEYQDKMREYEWKLSGLDKRPGHNLFNPKI